MNCPHCLLPVPEMWLPFITVHDIDGKPSRWPSVMIQDFRSMKEAYRTEVQWMRCPSAECLKTIVRARSSRYSPEEENKKHDIRAVIASGTDEREYRATTDWEDGEWWFAVPKRRAVLPIDPLIPERYAADFREACLILEDSPRMSAVLSRRILNDLLEEFGGYPIDGKQLQAFIDDQRNPPHLRTDVAYLKELGDIGAHTQRDQATSEIVDVEPKEAEWSLDVIAGLFDHWIVGPAMSQERRAALDGKVERAGRRPMSRFWKRDK